MTSLVNLMVEVVARPVPRVGAVLIVSSDGEHLGFVRVNVGGVAGTQDSGFCRLFPGLTNTLDGDKKSNKTEETEKASPP